MNLTLHVWRQAGPSAEGKLVKYEARDVEPEMSFLEMLDVDDVAVSEAAHL